MRKESFDPGLTTQFSGELRRAINPDGTFNVHRKGTRLRDENLYLQMIDTTWPRFFLVVAMVFLAVNVAFAWLYLAIGIGQLQGTESEMSAFVNAFFFSVHTLTTVGYGNVFPRAGHRRMPWRPPRSRDRADGVRGDDRALVWSILAAFGANSIQQ